MTDVLDLHGPRTALARRRAAQRNGQKLGRAVADLMRPTVATVETELLELEDVEARIALVVAFWEEISVAAGRDRRQAREQLEALYRAHPPGGDSGAA